MPSIDYRPKMLSLRKVAFYLCHTKMHYSLVPVFFPYSSCIHHVSLNDNSILLQSATNQVYHSLAELIKWSDSSLTEDGRSSLDRQSVGSVVKGVQDAVKVRKTVVVEFLTKIDVG